MLHTIVPSAGTLLLIVAAIGFGIAALIKARHVNQMKHHEIEPN